MSDMYCEISYYILFQKQAEIKTQKPVLKNDVFTESRIPTRNEMLLKMSEEKRLEKLQKERAKLLEATLMRPEEMVKLMIYIQGVPSISTHFRFQFLTFLISKKTRFAMKTQMV